MKEYKHYSLHNTEHMHTYTDTFVAGEDCILLTYSDMYEGILLPGRVTTI